MVSGARSLSQLWSFEILTLPLSPLPSQHSLEQIGFLDTSIELRLEVLDPSLVFIQWIEFPTSRTSR